MISRKTTTLILLGVLYAFSLAASGLPGGVNVKDFGAKGDGFTDDTEAIKKAIQFVQGRSDALLLARQPMVDDLPEMANQPVLSSTTEGTRCPELYFPAGRYMVSDTLVGYSITLLRGEEGAEIAMTDPSKDILYIHWGYRARVSGLTFIGGRRQVLFYTANNDMANLCVENCAFRDSSGYALWSHNYRNPDGHDFATMTLGPYSVAKPIGSGEFPVLVPNREDLPYFANSTLITVDDCSFIDCAGAIDMASDGMEIADCSIATDIVTRPPIKGRGRFVNLSCEATSANVGSCWIEGNFAVDILGGRYAVKDGSPCALLTYPASGRGEIASAVVIRNVQVKCGDAPLLRILNGEMESTPFILDMDGVETPEGPVQAVEWECPFEMERAIGCFHNWKPYLDILNGSMTTDNPFRWSFDNCPDISLDDIPEPLLEHRSGPVPKEVLKAVTIGMPSADWKEPYEELVLDGSEFGLGDSFESDDTEAMEKLFAAASKANGAVKIILPPVLLRISRPLQVPSSVEITAAGLATIRQSDPTQPIFIGEDVECLRISQLRLVSGSEAVNIHLAKSGNVLVDKSFFYQQKKVAVRLAAGEGNTASLNVARCLFVSPVQGVDTDASVNCLRNVWVSTNGRQDRQAFFVNRGGDMLLHGMCGVPMPMKDHGHNHLPFVKGWPFANDLRWVDNYGRFHSEYSRYGGEYYGIVPVFNFTEKGTVAIEGSFACFAFPDCQKCLVFCEKTPAAILLRDFGWEFLRPSQYAAKYPDDAQRKADVRTRNFLFDEARIHGTPGGK